jgi:hypothetical protein
MVDEERPVSQQDVDAKQLTFIMKDAEVSFSDLKETGAISFPPLTIPVYGALAGRSVTAIEIAWRGPAGVDKPDRWHCLAEIEGDVLSLWRLPLAFDGEESIVVEETNPRWELVKQGTPTATLISLESKLIRAAIEGDRKTLEEFPQCR